MNESAPALSMIFSATTREPLPDTGRRNISDISSLGIEKNSHTGAAAFSMNSIAPEDVSVSMAMNIPIMNGSMSKQVRSPSRAPSMNTS